MNQLAQCGIGQAIWEQYCAEHVIDVTGKKPKSEDHSFLCIHKDKLYDIHKFHNNTSHINTSLNDTLSTTNYESSINSYTKSSLHPHHTSQTEDINNNNMNYNNNIPRDPNHSQHSTPSSTNTVHHIDPLYPINNSHITSTPGITFTSDSSNSSDTSTIIINTNLLNNNQNTYTLNIHNNKHIHKSYINKHKSNKSSKYKFKLTRTNRIIKNNESGIIRKNNKQINHTNQIDDTYNNNNLNNNNNNNLNINSNTHHQIVVPPNTTITEQNMRMHNNILNNNNITNIPSKVYTHSNKNISSSERTHSNINIPSSERTHSGDVELWRSPSNAWDVGDEASRRRLVRLGHMDTVHLDRYGIHYNDLLNMECLGIIGDTPPMYGLTLQEKMDRMDR